MIHSSTLVCLRFAAIATGLLLISGCSGPENEGPPPAEAAAMRPMLALRGDATFFDGQVDAVVTVSRGRFGHFGGGPGGGGHHGGGRHHRRGGGAEEPDYGSEEAPVSTLQGATRPPVTLEVTLRNLSKAPVDLQIRDVNSELGNFAVRPERVLLAPDQESELDPMVSRLAEVGDDLVVTVVLRLGTATESHPVTLHPIEAARQDK